MSQQDKEKFNTIVKEFKEGSLDKLPKQTLEDYRSFLTECGAVNALNVDTYYQICNHLRTLLMHQETQKNLEELKKPHWTVIPIFVLALISAIAAVTGIFITLNSKSQTIVSTNHEPEKTIVTPAQKKPEHQQNILRPISSSAASREQGSRR
jgi:hypothetical protein